MSTKIKNRDNLMSHGNVETNEALYGLSSYKKIAVIEVDDMNAVANNDVVYSLPAAALLQSILVYNYGSTAFVIATNAYLDVGGTHVTDDISTLASGSGNMLYLGDVMTDVSAAGTQILWDLGGTNTSAVTAKARIVIEYLTCEDAGI